MAWSGSNNPEMGGGRTRDGGGVANSRNYGGGRSSPNTEQDRIDYYRGVEARGWDNASLVGALLGNAGPEVAAAAASYLDANNRGIDTSRPDARPSRSGSSLGADEFGAGRFNMNAIGNAAAGFFGVHEKPTTIDEQLQSRNPNYRAQWGFDPMRAPALGAALGAVAPPLGAAYGLASGLYRGQPVGGALGVMPGLGPVMGAANFLGADVDQALGTRRPTSYGTFMGFGQDQGGAMRPRRVVETGMQFGR